MILSSFLGIFVLKLHYCYQVAKIISIFAVEKKKELTIRSCPKEKNKIKTRKDI